MSRYLAFLGRRWPLIAAALVAGAVLGGLFASLQSAQYDARIQFFVTASVPKGDSPYQGELFVQQRIPTYTETLNSPGFARALGGALGQGEDVAGLQSKIRVSAPSDTVVMDVVVRDASPKAARRTADGVAQVFPAYVAQLEASDRGNGPPVHVSVTRRAELPTVAATPNTRLYVVMGGVLGLLAGVGLTAAAVAFDDRLRIRRQVERAAGAPVIGTVTPRTPPRRDRRQKGERVAVTTISSTSVMRPEPPAIAVARDGDTPEAEEYRRIRAALRYPGGQRVDALLVTSAVRGQGKTATAANLALAFAQSGYHVALVDGDLRGAGLTRLLDLDRAAGLSNLLDGEMPLEDVTHTGLYGLALDVLPAGSVASDASELLSSPLLGATLEHLRIQSDMLIVDAPAVPLFADTLLLGQFIPAALLVTRLHSSRADDLRSAAEALHAIDCRVVGAVVARSARGRRRRRRATVPGGFRPRLRLDWDVHGVPEGEWR